MSRSVQILGLSGSTRSKSHNKVLVEIALSAAQKAGAEIQLLNLRDFELPFYDADLEERVGIPPGAAKLKALFINCDGFLISSPEYNGSLSGVLKNAIDWLSRPEPGSVETPFTLRAFKAKVAGIMSASPGSWGGVRGLSHLRQILSGMGTLVVAEQMAVPSAGDAFASDGSLRNTAQHAAIEAIGGRVEHLARAMRDGL